MFKKVATLQFKKVYASDNNGKYYWRDFVKQANSQPMTDANFVPKNFYEYDTKNFLYITARAISGMEKWGCNGNFDAFPWKELKSAYPTFCGKGFYIEHKEDDETDAKGIILDAQPDDDNEFINCICAISKEEYPDICEQILNGQLNQVSMSCLAAECECSKCHNVATREEELCEHMNPKHPNFCKGSLDGDKPIYEINKNIVFTGLSGVAVPADKDAFIFDVKASKKQNSKTINKEYNKYCRAKKEYEYINSLLEKEDTRKYIESQLKKAFQDIKGESWDEVLDNIQKAGYDFDEHYYDEPYHFIKALKDKKEYEIELFGYHNGSYEVIGISDTGRTYKDLGDFLVNSSLNKKADVEYISDTIKEIPPIDFYIEFMNAGKSKGVNTDINKDQLEIGIKVEMEHTTNPVIAEKIAMDHIKEIPNYYTLLAEMEAKAKFEFEQAKDIINKETNEEYSTKLGSKQFFKIKKANNSKIRIGDHVKINYKLGDWELNNVLGKVLDVRTNNNGDNYYIVKIFDTNTTYTFHDQDLTLIRSKLSSKKWFKIANNIDNYGLSELQRKELQNIIDHIDIVNEDEVVTWDELIESVNQDILDYDFMNKNKVNIIDYIEKELGQEIEVY